MMNTVSRNQEQEQIVNRIGTTNDESVFLERVNVSHVPTTKEMRGYWSVSTVWAGVDRAVADSTGCSTLTLANRLKAAIEAGVALGPAEVRTDVNGKTYVEATHKFFARRLNSDLKRLGF
jgi:hypothetical protein